MLHPDPDDPPRRRGNKAGGHGTWDTDRPPVQGIAGRETGQAGFKVLKNSSRTDAEPPVIESTEMGTVVNTDEWKSYNRLPESGRIHVTVCHTPGKRVWAKDEDGDGIREVHNNTVEGIWTGLRNFLRPFRGVNKVYLAQYVSVHEWAYNLKDAAVDFFRILCGIT